MPAQLKNFLLTEFLKNYGAGSNVDHCQAGDACGNKHLCAAVLQTGRACGSTCWGKRAMAPDSLQATVSSTNHLSSSHSLDILASKIARFSCFPTQDPPRGWPSCFPSNLEGSAGVRASSADQRVSGGLCDTKGF